MSTGNQHKKESSSGFFCPACGGRDARVTDSRARKIQGYEGALGKWRRRKCSDCGERFTTIEFLARDLSELKEDKKALQQVRAALEVAP